jgi:glycosyltransferase involved in cell wall biosynthesis
MFDGELLASKGFGAQTEPGESAPGDAVKFLFLARMVDVKGPLELVRAFARVQEKYPNARLILAGDGPALGDVTRMVSELGLEESAYLPGYVKGDDKVRLLSESDVFVLPTRHGEGCPVSLLEAMAAGLAVITTPVGGIPDIIEDGRNGLLIGSTEPEKIAEALERLLRDEEFRRMAGETNRREAWKKYEARQVALKIEEHYEAVAK